MKVVRLSTLDELGKIREAWNRLVDGHPDLTVFQRLEWLESWWKVFGGPLELFVLAVYDEQGRLAGAAPWCRKTVRVASWKIRNLRFIADESSDYERILAVPEREEEIWQVLLDYLQREKSQWDYLTLKEIPEKGLARMPKALPKSFAWQMEKSSLTFRLPLRESWAGFQESVNKRMIKKYFRQKKLLGDYRLAVYSGDQINADVLEQVTLVNRNAPLAKRTGSIFLHPEYRRFHTELHRSPLKDAVRIAVLSVGGVPAVYHYTFHYKGEIDVYNCCFNQNFEKLSIGLFMDLLNIETAFQERIAAIDYMRGDYSFKKQYNSECHQNYDWVLFKHGSFRTLYALARFSLRNLRQAYVRTVVPCKLALMALAGWADTVRQAARRQGWRSFLSYFSQGISRRLLQWGDVYNMKMKVRDLAACDLVRKPDTVAIRELFVSDASLLEQMVGSRNLPVMLSRFWSGDWCWGILHGERLAGYVWATSKEQVDKNLRIHVPLNHDELYLYDGIIHEHYRGAGLMGVLLREVAKDPRLKRWLYVTGMVDTRNVPQIKTMKKLGFTILEKISRINILFLGFQRSQKLVPVAECLNPEKQPQLTKK